MICAVYIALIFFSFCYPIVLAHLKLQIGITLILKQFTSVFFKLKTQLFFYILPEIPQVIFVCKYINQNAFRVFGRHIGNSALGLLLPLLSGISPGKLGEPSGVLESNSDWLRARLKHPTHSTINAASRSIFKINIHISTNLAQIQLRERNA